MRTFLSKTRPAIYLLSLTPINLTGKVAKFSTSICDCYYTASSFPQERLETMSTCGEAYLIKPDSFEDIEATIKNLVAAKQIAEKRGKTPLSNFSKNS